MRHQHTDIIMNKIGVILTIEKDQGTLDHCLSSLKNQTRKPTWVILALDSEDDKEDYDDFVKHYDDIHLSVSSGVGEANARNEAIQYAEELEPDYLIFATANTAFYPNYIQRMLEVIQDNDFVYCGYGKINLRVGGFNTVMPSVFNRELLLSDGYIPIQSMFQMSAVLGFSEDVGSLYDWDYFLKLSEVRERGVLCPEILFDIFESEGNEKLDTFLLHKKHPEIKQKEPDEIIEGVAFIMQNISSYSGGRVHSWLQALSIAELGIPITLYTDKLPPFVNDFSMYKQPKIKICDLEKLDVKADLYWSSPYQGHIKALQLSNKYDRWSVQPFFDPPDWQKKYHDGESYEAAIINPVEYKRQYEAYRHDKIKILSSTHNGIQGYMDFYGFDREQLEVIPPAINSRMINMFKELERKNWIVSTNRNVPSKAWDEALGAFLPYMYDYKFVIITNNANSILEKADKFGIPRSSLIIRDGGIPDSEKFMIFLQSKAMLVASHFEGFGMHLTEAMACGLGYASYELPSLTEIKNGYDDETKKRIHFAKFGDVSDLRIKLGEALENTDTARHPDFNFEDITAWINEVMTPLLKY